MNTDKKRHHPLRAFARRPLRAFARRPLRAFARRPMRAFARRPMRAAGAEKQKYPLSSSSADQTPRDANAMKAAGLA
jgi:hypothetical protein